MKKKVFIVVGMVLAFFVLDRFVGYMLNQGLEKYFGLNQHSKVLLVGHSQLMLSVDKSNFEELTEKTVSKYCREGVNIFDRYEMIRQYLESPYSDSLECVLYGVDQFMFNNADLSKNSYKLFYPFMDNENIDEYIYASAPLSDYLIHKAIHSTRYSDALINSAFRGYLNNWNNYKFGKTDIEQLKMAVAEGRQRKIVTDSGSKIKFEESINLLKSRGIKIMLVGTPVVDILNMSEPEKYQEYIDYMNQLAQSPDIEFWDLNPEFSSRHELFFDNIHLNRQGQAEVNKSIAERLKTYYDINSNTIIQ